MAHARNTDPNTSHEAAASVTDPTLTQRVIFSILENEPMTDEELVIRYKAMIDRFDFVPMASESGIRSRRNELARAAKVFPVGYKKTKSGRKAIVWEAA
jgi:hypothetical protein